MAVIWSYEENTSDCILSSSINTILSRASTAINDITENVCLSFQIITIDDITQIVHKLAKEDNCSTYFPIFIHMEVERTLLKICKYDDQTISTAVILYNLVNAYKVLPPQKPWQLPQFSTANIWNVPCNSSRYYFHSSSLIHHLGKLAKMAVVWNL